MNEDADGEGDGDDTASDLDNPWQRAPLAHPSEERRTGTVHVALSKPSKRILYGTTTRTATCHVDLDLDLASYQ